MFGNSFTINEVNTIHDEFKNDYSDFKAIAGLGKLGRADRNYGVFQVSSAFTIT